MAIIISIWLRNWSVRDICWWSIHIFFYNSCIWICWLIIGCIIILCGVWIPRISNRVFINYWRICGIIFYWVGWCRWDNYWWSNYCWSILLTLIIPWSWTSGSTFSNYFCSKITYFICKSNFVFIIIKYYLKCS